MYDSVVSQYNKQDAKPSCNIDVLQSHSVLVAYPCAHRRGNHGTTQDRMGAAVKPHQNETSVKHMLHAHGPIPVAGVHAGCQGEV